MTDDHTHRSLLDLWDRLSRLSENRDAFCDLMLDIAMSGPKEAARKVIERHKATVASPSSGVQS